MKFQNPTPIQIGAWGTFNGLRYRVAGRVVVGCDVAGQRYYWNEFYLVGERGDEATLVHEVGERGIEWRMFVLFEPEFPLSAAEAAQKRVGHQINLEGTNARITLVDESRVYHIEGEASEGVELGDVANYFNARLGKDMIVVSWTGAEVEYYRGKDLSGGLVATAFGLRGQDFTRSLQFSGSSSAFESSNFFGGAGEDGSLRMLQIILGVLLLAMLFVGVTTCRTPRRTAVVASVSAPAAPFGFGVEGKLDGKIWQVRAHAVVEIAQVGRVFDRHEYHLTDADGNRALLVCGMKPRTDDWVWFTPLAPINPPTPAQCGALRVGETVSIDGWSGPITELFQAVNRQASSELLEVREGGLQFGFTVQSGTSLVQARWNATSITFHRGKVIPAAEVKSAFGQK
jgi:hypothetical protein